MTQRRVSKQSASTVGAVGVIGLGIMGHLMARSLLARGATVWGHDPIAAMRRRCGRLGAQVPGSNAAVAQHADLLILSLPSAAALHAVVDELATVPPPCKGQLVLETSTLPLADKLAAARALKRQGRQMLDAPISGTATPTPDQVWVMYLSGPVAACRRAAPLVSAFTLAAPRVGALGAGIKLKIAANHLVGIYNVACAELVALCRAMGLDPQVALDHIGHSPYIGSGLMRLRMPMMIRRQYEPATMKVDLWQKDMQVIGQMAEAASCALPLLQTCARIYDAAQAQGRGVQDTASVAEVFSPPLPKPAVPVAAASRKAAATSVNHHHVTHART
jgi:3-hydroxyisobutyrate dehydrogenase-like beta-hydroxyacid dehydrogenase